MIFAQPGDGFASGNIGTLVYIPAGTFQRDATAANTSAVSAFHMSQHEITRAQFIAIMGPDNDPSLATYSSGMCDPVQYVNWYSAITFCNKLSLVEGLSPVYSVRGVDFATLAYAAIPNGGNAIWDAAVADWSASGYRLPTETEWMWAAMGAAEGTTGCAKAFAGSTGSNAIGDYAWTFENSGANNTSQPTGTRLPNELGLYDMSGNVWEWTQDWYGTYPEGTLTDYRGPARGTVRVGRGGSWFNEAEFAALAFRHHSSPGSRNHRIGFRVVRR